MDCNKEEAIRAKQIAEKKMENKDFFGARKIALKAQQLYPNLENISQMIMVCDVHCSSENKVFGTETDWYGILKVEPTADELSIKKQYRKFALLLHPDKNNFSGAADAFKLIGEAQRVLLDCEKRMLHDRKCKASTTVAPNWGPQQASSNPNVGKQPLVQNHFMSKGTSQFTGFRPQHQQAQRQTQPALPNDQQTFWTVCPFCSVRYQYHRFLVNKLLRCPNCRSTFTGHEIKARATPAGNKWSRPAFPQQKEVPSQGAFKANLQGDSGNTTSKVGSHGNFSSEGRTREFVPKVGTSEVKPKKGSISEVGGNSKTNEKCGYVDTKSKKGGVEESKCSGRANREKRKHVTESSESCDTGSSSDFEEDIVIKGDGDVLAKQNFGCYGEYPRRSTRSKQHISYDENSDDNDNCGKTLKRAKYSGSFRSPEQQAEDPLLKEQAPKSNKPDSCMGSMQNVKEEIKVANGEIGATNYGHKSNSEANIECSSSSNRNVATNPEIYEYPDPDFGDFDKDRKQECFAVGQTWAVYDTLDAMPRFYARIRKVFSPGFKVRITWLEAEPDDEDEIKWVDEGLPASCGKFKHGYSENTEDHPMFSHIVNWERGSKRDTYKIYPRKGETWALFKNWDIKWHTDLDSERKYEFEFVEVLSDYEGSIGVSVAYLCKLRGFSCLFCRTVKEGMVSCQISPNQLFRFSHSVPSFQMTGEERNDVPKGSFELDPACLPAYLEEIDAQDLKMEAASTRSEISCSESSAEEVKPVAAFGGDTSGCQVNKKTHVHSEHISSDHDNEDPDANSLSSEEAYEIPEPEFYNFDGEKSPEKFEIGQFWALYSDEDGLPKYYARIKKIDTPEFRLHVARLIASPLPKETTRWLDRDMLISCGRFRLEKGVTKEYTETDTFSHKLKVEDTDKKDVYVIIPRKGEVWAIYKNWSAEIRRSELENCEYDIVQILEENDMDIKVLVLEPVDGFKTVFRAQMEEGSPHTMKFPQKELLRFSHQIPAFLLTEERGGNLRGYWELHPAALPVYLLCPR